MPQIADDVKAIQKRRLEIFGERARWPEREKEKPKPEPVEIWQTFTPPWGFPFKRPLLG